MSAFLLYIYLSLYADTDIEIGRGNVNEMQKMWKGITS